MEKIQINLAISAEEFRRYYTGRAQTVRVRSVDGRMVHFPANRLRPFLNHNGVFGRYELELNGALKLISITKLE